MMAACLGLALSTGGAVAEPLHVVSLSSDPQSEVRRYLPFKAYLEQRLDGTSFTSVEVVALPRADLMVQAFLRDRAHLYIDSPMVALRIAQASGARPMLRRWRHGVPEFWADFIVARDSPLQSLDDLVGRTVAFKEYESTSGHFLPRSELLAEGLIVRDLSTLEQPAREGMVNALFYHHDDLARDWLRHGQVDAIVVSSRESEDVLDDMGDAVRVLASTMPVPRHIVLHNPNMLAGDVAALTEIFLAMDEHEEGRIMLDRWQRTNRFDHFPGGAEAALGPVRERLDLLEAAGAF